jgi:hypothetical protein
MGAVAGPRPRLGGAAPTTKFLKNRCFDDLTDEAIRQVRAEQNAKATRAKATRDPVPRVTATTR